MTVRLATLEDEEDFLRICVSIHKENGIFTLSPRKLRDLWEKYIRGQGGICGMIGPVGAVEGAAYLQLGSVYYSEDLIVDELFQHVLPEFRASQNAKLLAEWCKSVSKQMRIPLLVSVVSTKQTEAKIRFYRRRYGEPVGAFFKYEA
jgi:hypothetical protein